MKIYRYKMYSKASEGVLGDEITRFGDVRNYAVKMMEWYNKLHRKPKDGEEPNRKCQDGKTLSAYELSNYLARKKKNPKCATAKMVAGLPSQAVQDCIGRVYKGWRHYFQTLKKKKSGEVVEGRRVKKPHEIKPWLNKSFTLLQAGYKFVEDHYIEIGGRKYGYFKSQPIKGRIKRVTIKRDRCGDMWIAVLTDWNECDDAPRTGRAAGFDFGLKTFLTGSDGFDIRCPLFLTRSMKKHRRLSSRVGKKPLGSRNRKKARIALARFLRHITQKREDWQWKTAWTLIRRYDTICLEDLNMEGMKRLWGRKVSDLAFAGFVDKMNHLAAKTDRNLVFVDRWCPTSQMCHECEAKNPDTKDLRIREWVCPHCGKVHDRDRNAAINIYREGMSSLRRGSVRPRPERGGHEPFEPRIPTASALGVHQEDGIPISKTKG